MKTELQQEFLPKGLPVLPRARIAARYLVPAADQAAGGDWFDALPLAGGAVALVVGDVVGHGVAASAAMGQLRAVLRFVLATQRDLTVALG
jgi:serine phosphatase RsbU (regulator of sigma subunit)